MSIDFTKVITAEEKADMARAAFERAAQRAVDDHVENVAKGMGYNSAAHCASYAASTVDAWAEEAVAFIAWRDAIWLAVFAGADDAPSSIEDVIAGLPEWGKS